MKLLIIDGLAVCSLFERLRPSAQRRVVKQAEKVQSYHTWSGDVCSVNLKDSKIEQQQPMALTFQRLHRKFLGMVEMPCHFRLFPTGGQTVLVR